MEEIKEGERIHEDDRNKHTEDGDILEIVNSIQPELQALGRRRVPGEQPCTIYQVSKALRQANEKCYEPQLVSIGPYHRGKEGLQVMEQKKFEHLQAILDRNQKLNLEDCVKEIKKLEADARSCYSESTSLSLPSKEFVKMMVLDGCFLVEIFLRIGTPQIGDEQWLPHFITHDMLLLENQLPFFVLESIFSLVVPNQGADLLKKRILGCCFKLIRILPLNEDAATQEPYHHVLDMFHHHCLPKCYADPDPVPDLCVVLDADLQIRAHSDPDTDRNAALLKADADIEAQSKAKRGPDSEHNSHTNPNADPPDVVEGRSHADPNSNALLSKTWIFEIGLIRRQSHTSPNTDPPDIIEGRSHNARWSRLASSLAHILIERRLRPLIRKWKRKQKPTNSEDRRFSIPSAEELQDAGIQFQRKKAKSAGSFLDVEFDEKGVLKIPFFFFSDDLRTVFQNLIAYEQCYPRAGTYFTGCAWFMDNLINTAKDVKILRHARIMENGLGSNDELAQRFNEMCRHVYVPIDSIHLSRERKAIDIYCRKKLPKWRAKLMRNYFHSPWAIISLFAAVLLLLLTITQTVFSIIPNV